MKTSVVIADDHPLLRQGLSAVITSEDTFEVVGEAGDGDHALQLIRQRKPDIAVLDINMPKLNGFGVARAMHSEKSQTSIIFITIHSSEDLLKEALGLGVKGYIVKDSSLLDIAAGLRAVRAGQCFVPPNLMKVLLGNLELQREEDRPSVERDRLTPSERRILQLIAAGKSSKQIASELFIHYKTVENHRTNISQKLGVSGPHALLRFALQNRTMF